MIIEEASTNKEDALIVNGSINSNEEIKENLGVDCVICSEPIKILKKLHCGHAFHLFCAAKWLEKGNKTCPLCRSEIKSYNAVFRHNQSAANSSQQLSNSINVLQIVIRIPNFVSRLIPNFNYRVIE